MSQRQQTCLPSRQQLRARPRARESPLHCLCLHCNPPCRDMRRWSSSESQPAPSWLRASHVSIRDRCCGRTLAPRLDLWTATPTEPTPPLECRLSRTRAVGRRPPSCDSEGTREAESATAVGLTSSRASRRVG